MNNFITTNNNINQTTTKANVSSPITSTSSSRHNHGYYTCNKWKNNTTTKIRFFFIIGISMIGNIIFHLPLIEQQVVLGAGGGSGNKDDDIHPPINLSEAEQHYYSRQHIITGNSSSRIGGYKKTSWEEEEEKEEEERKIMTIQNTTNDYYYYSSQKYNNNTSNTNNAASSTTLLVDKNNSIILPYDDLASSIITKDGKLKIDINFTLLQFEDDDKKKNNKKKKKHNNNNKMFCLPWTINTDDWWTHHPRYYVSYENGTHYCFGLIQQKKKLELFERIYKNQWRRKQNNNNNNNDNNNCSNIIITQRMWQSGFGADMSHVVEALLYGLSNQRPVQVSNDIPWHYAKPKLEHKNSRINVRNNNNNNNNNSNSNSNINSINAAACPLESMYCYFLNLTNCSPNNSKAYGGTNMTEYFVGIPQLADTIISWLLEYTTRQQTWLRHEVWKFITKKQQIASLLKSPCSVIHVRRSDVVLHGQRSRRYHALEEYIDAFPPDRKNNNMTPILLLTDDSTAIMEATTNHPDYNWIYIDRPRFKGSEGGWENQIPSQDPKQEIIVLMSIFKLVRRCNLFVHTSSNLASIIAGIMKTGNRRRNTQIIDLDSDKATYEIYNYSNSIIKRQTRN